MPYVASAGVLIDMRYPLNTTGEWVDIKTVEGIEYRWRVKDKTLLQVVAGIFQDGKEALSCAKRMYVNLIFAVMRSQAKFGEDIGSYVTRDYVEELDSQWTKDEYYGNEQFFYWDKHTMGNLCGPAVLEVSQGMDEADEYLNIVCEIYVQWDMFPKFDDVDSTVFPYTEETLPLLSALVDASRAEDLQLGVTLFTTMLEHLADEREKPSEVRDAVDKLIVSLEGIDLDKQAKSQVKNYLLGYKREGARNRVRRIAAEHAHASYGGLRTHDIVNAAYDVRSAYAHGGYETPERLRTALFIRYVAMDVVRNILMGRYAQ